jgi:hypothetical protein
MFYLKKLIDELKNNIKTVLNEENSDKKVTDYRNVKLFTQFEST